MPAAPLKLNYRAVGDLVPCARNARTHSDGQVAQIAGSICEFGFTNPVLVDERGGIIAGHGRVLAARKLGMAEVPTITLAGLTEAQRRAYVLADNQLALNAGWDEEMLAVELGDLKVEGFDLGLIGFSDADLASLLGSGGTIGLTDPDEVPELAEDAVSVLGDVWLLGSHRLACGDSTIVDVVGKVLAGGAADCMWTDPPYGVSYVGKTKKALTIQNDGSEGLDALIQGAFAAALTALKPGAAIYCAHPPGERSLVFYNRFAEFFIFRQGLVWNKGQMVLGHSDYHYSHEPIIFGYTRGGTGRRGRGGDGWFGDNAQTSVFDVKKPPKNTDHPTSKPVELIDRCLLNSTAPGHTVFEPFSGSGSTLIACEKTTRNCRAIELDPRYVDVAIRRWQDYTGKAATLEGDGRTFEEFKAAAHETPRRTPAI